MPYMKKCLKNLFLKETSTFTPIQINDSTVYDMYTMRSNINISVPTQIGRLRQSFISNNNIVFNDSPICKYACTLQCDI